MRSTYVKCFRNRGCICNSKHWSRVVREHRVGTVEYFYKGSNIFLSPWSNIGGSLAGNCRNLGLAGLVKKMIPTGMTGNWVIRHFEYTIKSMCLCWCVKKQSGRDHRSWCLREKSERKPENHRSAKSLYNLSKYKNVAHPAATELNEWVGKHERSIERTIVTHWSLLGFTFNKTNHRCLCLSTISVTPVWHHMLCSRIFGAQTCIRTNRKFWNVPETSVIMWCKLFYYYNELHAVWKRDQQNTRNCDTKGRE